MQYNNPKITQDQHIIFLLYLILRTLSHVILEFNLLKNLTISVRGERHLKIYKQNIMLPMPLNIVTLLAFLNFLKNFTCITINNGIIAHCGSWPPSKVFPIPLCSQKLTSNFSFLVWQNPYPGSPSIFS